VYIAGTTDFGPNSDEPFDMASNLAALADSDAGSYTATLDAMEQAGVQAGDPVHLFGHSQGGLVAARLAASGAFDTQSLVTFGSPSGQVPVPDSVLQVAVEHTEDLVPALGGAPLDGADGRDRTVVSRSVFDDAPPSAAESGSAHYMTEYEKTARLIDGSADPRLAGLDEALAGIGTGAGVAQAFRAERVRSG
jgi:pimeloyl-ACP methyl ester carboxylesterase